MADISEAFPSSGEQLAEQMPGTGFMDRLQRRPRARWLVERINDAVEWLREDYEWTEGEVMSPAEVAAWQEAATILIYPNTDKYYREVLGLEEGNKLDAHAYAARRIPQSKWHTVEIGPGYNPSGLNRRFEGDSDYTALENYSFRDFSKDTEHQFARIRSERPGENINLLDESHFGYRYGDTVNNRYSLPDEVADEIIVSRVYDKPSWAWVDNGDQQDMTDEIARMLKVGGHVIIADMTNNVPEIAAYLHLAGLEIVYAQWAHEHEWRSEEEFRQTEQGQLMEALGLSFCAPALIIARKPETPQSV